MGEQCHQRRIPSTHTAVLVGLGKAAGFGREFGQQKERSGRRTPEGDFCLITSPKEKNTHKLNSEY